MASTYHHVAAAAAAEEVDQVVAVAYSQFLPTSAAVVSLEEVGHLHSQEVDRIDLYLYSKEAAVAASHIAV